MIRIKVCGITREADFRLAAELGADYIGFVFHRPSPRYIEPAWAALLGQDLTGDGPLRVGVFVNEPVKTIAETIRIARLDRVQLHGEEGPDFNQGIPCPSWKAFRIGRLLDLDALEPYRHWAMLLADTRVEGVYGGSGVPMAADLAAEVVRRFPGVFLAGGITVHNLSRILTLGPGGIDFSSGLEERPGFKSPEKMQKIFDIVGALRETPSLFADHPAARFTKK
jgi:phosphoribosylanthranilate isomerase